MSEFALLIQLFLAPAFSEGVKSPYTDRVQSLMSDDKVAPASFLLKCWTDPKNDLYMGVEQRVKIPMALPKVEGVIDAVDEYVDLFPGFKQIKLLSHDDTHMDIFFEQTVPVPFVPNIKYEMLYTLSNPSPTKRIYRYQLKEAGTIKSSDGLIILKGNADSTTDYTEFDFFDADWGLAKVAGKNKLWHDSVEGIYLSDLAILFKSEDAKMTDKDARKLAKDSENEALIDTCVKNRANWPLK